MPPPTTTSKNMPSDIFFLPSCYSLTLFNPMRQSLLEIHMFIYIFICVWQVVVSSCHSCHPWVHRVHSVQLISIINQSASCQTLTGAPLTMQIRDVSTCNHLCRISLFTHQLSFNVEQMPICNLIYTLHISFYKLQLFTFYSLL